jgi:hypothetical protein
VAAHLCQELGDRDIARRKEFLPSQLGNLTVWVALHNHLQTATQRPPLCRRRLEVDQAAAAPLPAGRAAAEPAERRKECSVREYGRCNSCAAVRTSACASLHTSSAERNEAPPIHQRTATPPSAANSANDDAPIGISCLNESVPKSYAPWLLLFRLTSELGWWRSFEHASHRTVRSRTRLSCSCIENSGGYL